MKSSLLKLRRQRQPAAPQGFTLVEMLVAVALVLLLMSLFAQVFQIAGSSISTQRGLMENDQRARTAQTLIKADLDKRTFRTLVPFTLNEEIAAPEVNSSKRRGYFSISENDPTNDGDDVLTLTVDARVVQDTLDRTLYYGQALALVPSSLSTSQQYSFFRSQSNQPERDDGRLDPNDSADSDAAEVAYFLRGGNLFRRVLLLRQPEESSATNPQPEFDVGSGPRRFFDPNTTPVYPGDFLNASNFWRDFDFSAHSSQSKNSAMPPVYSYDGALFNGVSSLDVPVSIPFIVDTAPDQLAYPPNRFGHNYVNRNPISSGDYAIGGQPKEYTQSGGIFLGRFTQHETSDGQFLYPQQDHLSGNCPMGNDLDVVNGHLVVAANNAVNFTDNGPRRGEDLLLSNVHSFDIKVYDEVLKRFVDIGHSEPAVNGLIGDFHISNRANAIYGSGATTGNRVFDTWYPFNSSQPEDADGSGAIDGSEVDQNANGQADPLQVLDFDGSGGIGDEDGNGDGMLAGGEDGNSNGIMDHENFPPYRPRKAYPDDVSLAGFGRDAIRLERWQANFDYNVGDRIFPPLGTQRGDPFYYVCIRAQDGDGVGGVSSQGTAPSFVRIAGMTTEEGVLAASEDQLTWLAVDNSKPLRAIQISLRFLDPSTSQMRTLTIQHGLID